MAIEGLACWTTFETRMTCSTFPPFVNSLSMRMGVMKNKSFCNCQFNDGTMATHTIDLKNRFSGWMVAAGCRLVITCAVSCRYRFVFGKFPMTLTATVSTCLFFYGILDINIDHGKYRYI